VEWTSTAEELGHRQEGLGADLAALRLSADGVERRGRLCAAKLIRILVGLRVFSQTLTAHQRAAGTSSVHRPNDIFSDCSTITSLTPMQ
jgi:hypothetical protein